MEFAEYKPAKLLSDYVVNFWTVRSENHPPGVVQKIVPDGYPEIIFHFGDSYEIKLFDSWQTQAKFLFSGQISNHFYLRNTGAIHMLGIKFQPMAPNTLFGINLKNYTDKVVDIAHFENRLINQLHGYFKNNPLAIDGVEEILIHELPAARKEDPVVKDALGKIKDSQGQVRVEELASGLSTSRRTLERRFAELVGLSPKYYARIIRFNSIFKLMQAEDNSWCQLAVDSGFFDQAHFIREFKTFTGEAPSKYGFDEATLANFFLHRK